MTGKIRSVRGPLIKDHEMGLVNGGLAEFEKISGNLEFWGKVQRRGTHVNTLKIGSRGVCLCFGGILGSYADLRREFGWVRLEFGVFGRVVRGITWGWEEGGHLWCFKNV
jgi:hypothetical protein